MEKKVILSQKEFDLVVYALRKWHFELDCVCKEPGAMKMVLDFRRKRCNEVKNLLDCLVKV